MGVLLSIIFATVVLFMQSFYINSKQSTAQAVTQEQEEKIITKEINSINNIKRDVVDIKEKNEVMKKICKETYSNILKCEKRHTYDYENSQLENLNPAKEFCNAFYSYSYKKSENKRPNQANLKELLADVMSIQYTSENQPFLYNLNNEINRIGTPIKLNEFTEDVSDNEEVFKRELYEYTLGRMANSLNLDMILETPELTKIKKFYTPYDNYIKLATQNDTVDYVSSNSKSPMFSDMKIYFPYVGTFSEIKSEGKRYLLKTLIKKLSSVRDSLIKMKDASPEIDLYLNYRQDETVIMMEEKYALLFDEFYDEYKLLLEIIKLKDEELFVNLDYADELDISYILQYDEEQFNEFIKTHSVLVKNNVLEVGAIEFKSPYSDYNKYTIMNKTTKDELSKIKNDIISSEICDINKFKRGIRQ